MKHRSPLFAKPPVDESARSGLMNRITNQVLSGGMPPGPVVVGVGIFLVGAISATLLKDSFQVFETAADIPGNLVKANKCLTGVVVKVTDGDTIRVRHKSWGSSGKWQKGWKLAEHSLAVRIAGVDTPETAKFGSTGQPLGKEAKQFVERQLPLGRKVSVQLLSKDQYERIVAKVSYGTWPFKKDLSEELLKKGLAVIYRQTGAEYAGKLPTYEKLESKAKSKKMGVWQEGLESPAEYKRRQKAAEK
eukprot:CAMPEP_0113935894 /NCGR_PEP_ID=MMETSP1339-20121228/2931_1 /TAXON_ID=94617 /ORGANISM="Fibrocapsa japonica" /LENGTH=246 /DNA_ID=CAMNT_0000938185 /DNA_START=175 /DNA_END=915 /DNA_ORIENTATION=+ /assembly_acc=CAM_ASM_000762